MLRNLLYGLQRLNTDGRFTYSVNVVDNDADRSAKTVVEEMQPGSPVTIRYFQEPERNIARARNKAIENAAGDFVAFIDDDEVPEADWLFRLLAAMDEYGADGVLGPVLPNFDSEPPEWIVKGKFCERPTYKTGTVLHWSKTRTGNVLLRAGGRERQALRFDPYFGIGGEDIHFFKHLASNGRKFVWCNEAPVHEAVPKERCTKRYFLKRSFLQGYISVNYYKGDRWALHKAGFFAKSLLAMLSYTILLPATALLGTHRYMKYLTKDIYHLGRFASASGIVKLKSRLV